MKKKISILAFLIFTGALIAGWGAPKQVPPAKFICMETTMTPENVV
ncbi:hypothetical protein [Chitinophaga qingshengii]|uniref:Uncharacterized protein n=1 Tax=Chitinophaga qingshengii TaxID=1569794 RepID=A0ABR7TP54_9BACT|nr:hypothetical protein [Chitinophaga qingshengii]MBC9931770.1 hypothetical protein [Chitinophaga qingshengii]